MSANSMQVGGDHYKPKDGEGEQHWDRQWRLYGRGYFVGCITKYVERYHLKNGLEDLRKARHFLDKLIELEEAVEKREAMKGLDYTIPQSTTLIDPFDEQFQAEVAASRRRENAA